MLCNVVNCVGLVLGQLSFLYPEQLEKSHTNWFFSLVVRGTSNLMVLHVHWAIGNLTSFEFCRNIKKLLLCDILQKCVRVYFFQCLLLVMTRQKGLIL